MTKNSVIKKIVTGIQQVINHSQNNREVIGLHEPYFQGNEWVYLKDCLDTGWVSSVGQYVDRFERMLAEYTGARRAIAVVNGTAALQICLKMAGVRPNDEVIVPALTFVATANAVAYLHAIPHFVDSNPVNLGIDVEKLDHYLREVTVVKDGECINKITQRRIKAVVPMHVFGHPVDMDALLDLTQRYRLELVEDAAESLGSLYKGKHTGTFGKLSAISFNGNKVITTGGGGAILTNDDKLGEHVKHLISTAKVAHRWAFIHDEIGYNYRMPNINAALGCAQLEQIDQFLLRKRKLAEDYFKVFIDMEEVDFVCEPEYARSNYWLNAIKLADHTEDLRDDILAYTNDMGIMTRPVWQLMHKLEMYENNPRMDLSQSERLEKKVLNIPSSVFLSEVE